jgi:hypothetical protein
MAMTDAISHDGYTFVSSVFRPSDGKFVHTVETPAGDFVQGACNADADSDEIKRMACEAVAVAVAYADKLNVN